MRRAIKISCGLILDTLPIASFLLCLSAGSLALRDEKSSIVAASLLVQSGMVIIHFAHFMSLELMLDQSSPKPVGEDDAQSRFREPLKMLPVYSAVFCAVFQLIQFDPRNDAGSSLLILFISAFLHVAFMQHKLAQRSLKLGF